MLQSLQQEVGETRDPNVPLSRLTYLSNEIVQITNVLWGALAQLPGLQTAPLLPPPAPPPPPPPPPAPPRPSLAASSDVCTFAQALTHLIPTPRLTTTTTTTTTRATTIGSKGSLRGTTRVATAAATELARRGPGD